MIEQISRLRSRNEVVIAPALLGAPVLSLGESARAAISGGADVLHIDVMDGSFVSTISFGDRLVSQLRAEVNMPIDVHLLVDNPEEHVPRFARAGAAMITVHVEAVADIEAALQKIHDAGALAGVALNPGTPLEMIEPAISLCDLLMVMTVEPGTSALVPSTIDKVRRGRLLLDAKGRGDVPIAVDGGVSMESIADLAKAGGRWFVAASAVFGGGPTSVPEAIGGLRSTALAAIQRPSELTARHERR